MRTYNLQLENTRTNRHVRAALEIDDQPKRVVLKFTAPGLDRSFDGFDFLEGFERLREDLEPQGWRLLCMGARRDALVSGMSRDMGGGEVVYLFNEDMRKAHAMAPAAASEVTTVALQREFQMSVNWSVPNGDTLDRFKGCLLGLACGDAVGTTLEFKRPGSFDELTDMVGGGVFNLSPGQWTDDTSMALCLAESLVEQRGFDALDQMQRYLRWWRTGYMSSTGACFDIGNATRDALASFERTKNPFSGSTDPRTAGNGSIMRLAPVPMYFFNHPGKALEYCVEGSRTTHGALECDEGCRLFGMVLLRALEGKSRLELFEGLQDAYAWSDRISAVAQGLYMESGWEALKPTGYVVDTLEAAFFCFRTTSSFERAILRAANLGGDADTIAAVCGQLAGAFYGANAIPNAWREKLYMHEFINDLAERLHTLKDRVPPDETSRGEWMAKASRARKAEGF